MSRRMASAARKAGKTAAGAVIIAVIIWHVGAAPFLEGLRAVNFGSIAAAGAITALTTTCAAWRWLVVSRALGAELPLRQAVGGYYQSQFLNATLPSGVLGDVHRAVDQGHTIGDVGRGIRAVAWERTAGQLVQAILAVAVLAVLPSSVLSAAVRSTLQIVGAVVILVVAVVLVLSSLRRSARYDAGDDGTLRSPGWGRELDRGESGGQGKGREVSLAPSRGERQCRSRNQGSDQGQRRGRGRNQSRGRNQEQDPGQALCQPRLVRGSEKPRRVSRYARALRAVRSDLRVLLARDVWPKVGVFSAIAVAGYLAIFLIAAQLIDPAISLARLLPLGMVVLLASAVPLNVAGWGPREGVAAWAFAAAGLGAAQGVAVATVYGVLVICSCLPGAVVLLLAARHRGRATYSRAEGLAPGTLPTGSHPTRPLDGGAPAVGIPWPIGAAAHSEVAHG